MIRLLAILGVGIFLVLLIGGEDRGQMRQGLMAAPEVTEVERPARPLPAEPAPQVTDVVFVPAQPVRVTPPPAPVPVVAPAEPATAPEPRGTVAVVQSRSVNVRSGPSTNDPVVGRLLNGDEVLVVEGGSGVEGWSLIRIEGDGVRGFVASRFLTLSD